MYKIYIDSSKRLEKKVQLLKADAVVDELCGDIDMVASIKELLEKHHLNVADIAVFDVFKGPGSFTGLKMGVTIANVLNWAMGKKKSDALVYPEYGAEPNISIPK